MPYSVAVAGACGYAGGEMLRLLAAHPEVEVTHRHRAPERRPAARPPSSRTCARSPHLDAAGDDAPRCSPAHDVVFLALPHGKSGRVTDAAAGRRRSSSTAAPTTGSTDRGRLGRVLRRRLPRRLDVRRARAALARRARSSASGSSARPRIAVPGCNVTAITLALAPGIAAGVIEADDIVAVLAVGPSGAGKSLAPTCSRARCSARANPRTRSAARTGTSPRSARTSTRGRRRPGVDASRSRRCSCRCRAASSRPRRRRIAPGATRRDVRAAWEEAYADEPFVHVLPGGRVPAHGRRDRREHRAHRSRGRRARRTGSSWSARVDNLVKGTAGAAIQSANIALGLPETTGPPRERGRAVSVTARRRASRRPGVAAGPQVDAAGPTSRSSSTAGRCRAAAAVFTSNRAKANPIIWSQQVIADGIVEAIVLNSGGANCFTGAEGFQTTHATAEAVGRARSASRAGDVLVCSTGLIGDQLDRAQGARAASRAASPRSRADGGSGCRSRHHDDRLASRSARCVDGDGWTHRRHGEGRRDAGARPRDDARRDHDRRRRSTPPSSTPRCAPRPGSRFDRLDSDGCMSTNDQVTLHGERRVRRRARPRRVRRRRSPRCASTSPSSCRRDAEGASHDIAIEVVERRDRGRRRRGRPLGRPQQPLQGRDLRQRPELGPGARRDRHDAAPSSTRTTSTCR